jgi:hypothetical protein
LACFNVGGWVLCWPSCWDCFGPLCAPPVVAGVCWAARVELVGVACHGAGVLCADVAGCAAGRAGAAVRRGGWRPRRVRCVGPVASLGRSGPMAAGAQHGGATAATHHGLLPAACLMLCDMPACLAWKCLLGVAGDKATRFIDKPRPGVQRAAANLRHVWMGLFTQWPAMLRCPFRCMFAWILALSLLASKQVGPGDAALTAAPAAGGGKAQLPLLLQGQHLAALSAAVGAAPICSLFVSP